MDLAELHLNWGESKYKGKVYRSYNLARAYRQNGKNLKEIVVKLGKLSDKEIDQWRAFLKTFKESGYKSGKYENIVNMLLEIIKKQQAEIKKLQGRIETLEGGDRVLK